ncbi:aldehyde dehydrogenase [Gordonia phthalatica]|uniref:Aldehyde dehydrogenase n=1 Tax=Gordonia phthalatica TaxID=1136941 RepID=A0A0N9N7X8_9ACTN|nr:aldehyde dehydrogenase [Gordonia phthalatica]ALG83233.1 aldehyde dehydrogenase [Gordonia phthalatica]
MHVYDTLFIGGKFVPPASTETVDIISSSTEEVIGRIPATTTDDIDAAVAAARSAFDDPTGWSTWEPARRAEVLDRLADEIEARVEELTPLVAQQNGMPITLAHQLESALPAGIYRYYAELARTTEFEEVRPGVLGGRAVVRHLPVGVVGMVIPWNYPNLICATKMGPALAAGCTVVMKQSIETSLDSYIMAEAIQAAGVPDGVINFVPGGGATGAHLVAHSDIDKVSFTGSTAVGQEIGTKCGELMRPVTLELGGKSAGIVLDDADLAASVENLFVATLVNNGQTCVLSSRVLAPRSRYDEVVETLAGLFSSVKVGDALDPETQVGPVVSKRQLDRIRGYIAKGIEEGGRVVVGGADRPEGLDKGWFVQPTLFADVEPDSTIAQEEIFGPVVLVMPYDDIDDAVRIANGTKYGLAATIWTSDEEKGRELSRRIEAGTVGINHFMTEPVAPFGGMKASGLGRELGPEGLASCQHLQTVYLPPAS